MTAGPARWLLGIASLALLLATGCNSSNVISTQPVQALKGNWVFAAQSAQTVPSNLTLNAGLSSQSSGAVTAVAHLAGASCVSANTGIVLAGSVDSLGKFALNSQPFAGTTLAIKGQVAADGKSVSAAKWTFSGGSCAALGTASLAATQFSQVNGNYTGTFVDANNNQLPVTATLTQTTQPDQNGQFHLSGSANFPNNPCFTQPVVTDSLVTGSSLSATYAQGAASITAAGTFNSDATQLTITSWQVTGGQCDGDSGTGLLTSSGQ